MWVGPSFCACGSKVKESPGIDHLSVFAKNGCDVSYNWDAGETSYCASAANGTGPFKITLREQDVRTIFKRNKSWWGDQSQHNIDKIELLPIKNDATRIAALLSGEIDYTNVVPVQDLERIAASSAHKINQVAQNRTIFFGMDQGSAELFSSNETHQLKVLYWNCKVKK